MDAENSSSDQSQQHVWGDGDPQDNDMDYNTDNDSVSDVNDDANGPEMYCWQYGMDDGINDHNNDGNDVIEDFEELYQWQNDHVDVFADVIQGDDGQLVLGEVDSDDDDYDEYDDDDENDDANSPGMYVWEYYGIDDGINGHDNDGSDDDFEELDQWQDDHNDIFANVIQADDGQHVLGEVDGDEDGDENDDANRPEMYLGQYGMDDGINDSLDDDDISGDIIWADDRQHVLEDIAGDIDVVQFPTAEISQQQADAGSQCIFCLDDYDVGESVRQFAMWALFSHRLSGSLADWA